MSVVVAASGGTPEPGQPQPPLPAPTPGSPPVPEPGPLPGDPGPPLPQPEPATGGVGRAPAPGVAIEQPLTIERISVAGDIDITTGPTLAEQVRAAVESGTTEVHLDLSGATFVDSAGLVALLEARGAATSGGARLVLVRPSVSVRDLLWLTGLLGSFELDT